jgi:hypothetical protein
LCVKLTPPSSCTWAHPVVAVGGLFEKVEVVGHAEHRARVAGNADRRAFAEDRVHGPSLEAEGAQIAAREEGVPVREAL